MSIYWLVILTWGFNQSANLGLAVQTVVKDTVYTNQCSDLDMFLLDPVAKEML